MAAVLKDAGDASAAWLTEVLRERGLLKSEVTSVEHEAIGEGVGLMAALARLRLTYSGDEDLPDTMVVKTGAMNDNRGVAQLLDFYNREVNFYNNIGSSCPFRVPASYYGNVDDSTYDFVLLLEDLGDVSPVDQITGASETEAYDKVGKIARLHAKYWNKVDNDEFDWMYDLQSPDELAKLRDYLYLPALEPCIEKFSDHLNESSIALLRKVGRQFVEMMDPLSSNYTFCHGDFRQDNFIYRKNDGDVVVMDWQISGKAYPLFDFAYFVCQSLQVDLRREIERELMMHYLETLREEGVKGYDMETAWSDYRVLCLFCLVYPVTVCGTLDLANDRGRALAECMLDRNLAVIADLDCADLLTG